MFWFSKDRIENKKPVLTNEQELQKEIERIKAEKQLALNNINAKYNRFLVYSDDECTYFGEIDKIDAMVKAPAIPAIRTKLGLGNGKYKLFPVDKNNKVMYQEYWYLHLRDCVEYDEATDKFVVIK